MKKLLPRQPKQTLRTGLLGLTLLTSALAEVTPTEWRQRQEVVIPAAGLTRLALPDATFDACEPQLADLRLLDPAGREVSYLIDRPAAVSRRTVSAQSFSSRLAGSEQVLAIATGTMEPIASLRLESPHPHFLRAARVEISEDNSSWTTLDTGVPLFRQWGAEQLSLPLGNRTAAFIRITVNSTSVPFTAAHLTLAAGVPPPSLPVATRIVRREEFAGETVLTLELGGSHVPLAALQFETTEPLFMRRITVAEREADGVSTRELTVGLGTIYRVALDGAPARAQLELNLDHVPATRELLVHVHNGDSPPLAVTGITVQRQPWSVLFFAPTAGTYRLLAGNPQAYTPRYDIAGFAFDLRTAAAAALTPGPLEHTPDYQPRSGLAAAPLPDFPLQGAPLDSTAWTRHRAIRIDHPGVQELELDPAALAGAQDQYADLRLVRNGRQVPYLLEQTGLFRALTLAPVPVPDPKRPSVSVWRIDLPQAGLPLRRIVLTSPTPLFQRQIKIYHHSTNSNGVARPSLFASAGWSRTPEPGVPEKRTFEINDRPPTETLWIETDNGDNPPIELGPVQVIHPVVRLVFKTDEASDLTLAYGNRNVAAARYDLSLVADRLLAAPRHIARLGDEAAPVKNFDLLGSLRGGAVFWAALALVVVVLLTVVARLLPKPDAK